MAWASSGRPSHHSVRASEIAAHARAVDPADPAGGEGGTQARLTLIHLQRIEVCTGHVDAIAI